MLSSSALLSLSLSLSLLSLSSESLSSLFFLWWLGLSSGSSWWRRLCFGSSSRQGLSSLSRSCTLVTSCSFSSSMMP